MRTINQYATGRIPATYWYNHGPIQGEKLFRHYDATCLLCLNRHKVNHFNIVLGKTARCKDCARKFRAESIHIRATFRRNLEKVLGLSTSQYRNRIKKHTLHAKKGYRYPHVINGVNYSRGEICELTGISAEAVRIRYKKYGNSPELLNPKKNSGPRKLNKNIKPI